MKATRMETEIPHLGPCDRPVLAYVERNPGNFLGKKCLGAAVHAQSLRSERDLAGANQEIVEPGIPVEGKVGRRWSSHRTLARGERIEEHVGIPAIGLSLGERQIGKACLHGLERGL